MVDLNGSPSDFKITKIGLKFFITLAKLRVGV